MHAGGEDAVEAVEPEAGEHAEQGHEDGADDGDENGGKVHGCLSFELGLDAAGFFDGELMEHFLGEDLAVGAFEEGDAVGAGDAGVNGCGDDGDVGDLFAFHHGNP